MWPRKRKSKPEELALFSGALRRALARPGCPICRLVRESEEKWIWTLLYEYTGDPRTHAMFSRAAGLCSHHGQLMRRVVEGRRLMTPSGVARLYETAVRELRAQLAVPKRRRDGCPLCSYAERTAGRQVYFLARLLAGEEWRGAFSASQGVCWPHLRALLPHASREVRKWALRDFSRRLEKLEHELAELQRKQRYDVPEGLSLEEADSWREALWRLGGMSYDHLLVRDDV